MVKWVDKISSGSDGRVDGVCAGVRHIILSRGDRYILNNIIIIIISDVSAYRRRTLRPVGF